MNTLKRFLLNNKSFIIIALLGLTPLLIFKKGLLIAGGDDFELLNPGAFTKYFMYVWNIKLLNAGGVLLAIPRLIPELFLWSGLRTLGVSNLVIERFWAVSLFLLPGISLYILMSKIYNKPWAKLIASALYMFNLYVMVVGPFQINTKLVLIALPLQFLFWRQGLNEGRHILKYALLIGFCSLIYSGSNVNPPAVAVIPIVLFIYLFFFACTHRREYLFVIKFIFVTAVSYILLNLWWMANFLFNIIPASGGVRGVATFSAISSGMLTDFFRLLGSWGWKSSHYQMPYFPYAHFYDEPFLLVLSFLIPVLVFLALFFKPKDKNVIFFTILSIFGIFLTKGSSAPFGFIYQWIWENVPGFWIFREPFAKFTPITLFSYSILLGISTQAIYEKLQNQNIFKRIPRVLVANSVPLFVLLAVLVVSFPMFTGDVIWHYWNGSMRSFHSQVPSYWGEIRDWLNKNDSNARVFLTPKGGYGAAYNWVNGLSTADAPALVLLDNPILRLSPLVSPADKVVSDTYNYFDAGEALKLTRSLGLLNADYILQANDLDWRYSGKTLTPAQANSFLESNFTKVAVFGMFDQTYLNHIPNGDYNAQISSSLSNELLNKNALVLYRLKETDYLPKFYVPQGTIYLNNGQEQMTDILSFSDFPARPAVYTSDSAAEGTAERKSLLARSNQVYVKTEKVEIAAKKSLVVSGLSGDLVMPKASLLPNSPFYFLVPWKEQILLNREHDDAAYIDQLLWFSSKRISEMAKLESVGRADLVTGVFKRYLSQLTDLESRLEKISRERADSYALMEKTGRYFSQHRNVLIKLKDRVSESAFADYFIKTSELYRRANLLLTGQNRSLYMFNIPEPGNYEILLKGEQTENYLEGTPYSQVTFTFDNQNPQELAGGKGSQGWYEYPSVAFEAGAHKLSFPSFKMTNLITNGSFEDTFDLKDAAAFQPSFESIDGMRSLKITANKYEEKKAYWPINSFGSNYSYSISFDYKNLIGSPLRFYVWEDRKKQNDAGTAFSSFETELTPGTSWLHFETAFSPNPDSRGAEIEFTLSGEDGRSVALLDNLRVERVIDPNILLKKRPDSVFSGGSAPKITFLRENPTKYKILVEKAVNPYTLVFSETFNREWKAFINTSIGSQSDFSSLFASYLNGDVKEAVHADKFLGDAPFNTLGLTSIPKNRHQIVNGYANSWYITPADANGQESYEIIIEYTPQRLFYATILISVAVFLVGAAYLITVMLRRIRVKAF